MDKILILNKIKEAKGFGNDTELAAYLGVNSSIIANWRTRKSVNLETIISNCEEFNLNWLFYNEGEIFTKGEAEHRNLLNSDLEHYKKLSEERREHIDKDNIALRLYADNEKLREKVLVALEDENAKLKVQIAELEKKK